MGRVFYKPEGAWAADFIPFYSGGRYHLFYLHDWRDSALHGEGTPWYKVSTDDFVHFVEHGEMLPRGSEEEQDLYVFTGSVIEAQGAYHIFYTGHNPHFPEQHKPAQAIMHAVSDDLLNWKKIPEHSFFAPADQYEPNDWRDPYVFWNPDQQEYWMLLAARLRTGPSRRRGCTALCTSSDLEHWRVLDPLWAPGLYYTHECPDLFAMGDWWYLVFSEFSERCITRYRMSRSPRGPWLAPADDTFDGRAFYAAKTASDGIRRFIFGWNATREQEEDYESWQWGGNLVVHEIVQRSGGTLAVRLPSTVDDIFDHPVPIRLQSELGDCRVDGNMVEINAHSSFGCATAGTMPEACKLRTTVTFTQPTQGFGIMLRVASDLESAYYIRLEPQSDRMVFDSWPRKGDVPFMVELERPLQLRPGRAVELEVLVDGTVCEVYAAGQQALSTRLYNLGAGTWGVFVQEGSACFQDVSLRVRGQ